MKRFHLLDPEAGNGFAATVYGENKRDALNRYREQWYKDRQRLPAGVEIWEAD